MSIANHAKQRFLAQFAIESPRGIENLVPAMFRIGLCEHHQFRIAGVTAEVAIRIRQKIDLIIRQRKSQ